MSRFWTLALFASIGACTGNTDTDTDTGASDTDTGASVVIVEDVWNEARGCWEQREIDRPAEYWSEPWRQDFEGDGCYSTFAGRFDCYDETSETFDFSDCQAMYSVYSSADGECTRYLDPGAQASTCPITDPWVTDCSLVDGCCDLTRAHEETFCPDE